MAECDAICTKCGYYGEAIESTLVPNTWFCGNQNCGYMVTPLRGLVVVPREFLRRLANEAWMRLDYDTNAEICRLLGEPSALEHEQGEDRP